MLNFAPISHLFNNVLSISSKSSNKKLDSEVNSVYAISDTNASEFLGLSLPSKSSLLPSFDDSSIISIISSSTYSENYNEIIDVDFPNKRKKVNSAIKVLNSAIEESSDDLTLYYYRGLLLFYLHRFFEAFLDFDYIVEKEDEPHSKYYLARGK